MFVNAQALQHDRADRLTWIERIIGILVDELDRATMALDVRSSLAGQRGTVEDHLPARRLMNASDGTCQTALAAAGLADERHDFTLRDRQRDRFDRMYDPAAPAQTAPAHRVAHGEIHQFQPRSAHWCAIEAVHESCATRAGDWECATMSTVRRDN